MRSLSPVSGWPQRRLLSAVLAALLGPALIAGLPGPAAAKDDVVLSLEGRDIRNLSSAGLTLVFRIAADNRSSAGRELVRYRMRFTVGQRVTVVLAAIDPQLRRMTLVLAGKGKEEPS